MTNPVNPYSQNFLHTAQESIIGLRKQWLRSKKAFANVGGFIQPTKKALESFKNEIHIIQCASRFLKPYLNKDAAAVPALAYAFNNLQTTLETYRTRINRTLAALTPPASVASTVTSAFTPIKPQVISPILPRTSPLSSPPNVHSIQRSPNPAPAEIFHSSPIQLQEPNGLSFEEVRLLQESGSEGFLICGYEHQMGTLSFEERRCLETNATPLISEDKSSESKASEESKSPNLEQI